MAAPPRELTTTNHALLGLLALRPHSAYELTGQMQRILRFIWPRAQSKVYESAKRLVTLGYATAERQPVGRRHRTVYTITPAGRQVLEQWLRRPGGPPALEFEAAVKLLFADLADRDDALATLRDIAAWAEEMHQFGVTLGREYLTTGGGPYPQRLHINALLAELLWRHCEAIRSWALWANEQVLTWQGSGPQPHRTDTDLDVYRRIAREATPTEHQPAEHQPAEHEEPKDE
ncbi:MAG: PadR family transcriptional regulator [Pseudonocardiaceae bacterium]